ASAPTTRYSTSFEFKHSTNSRKSLLSGIGMGSLPDRKEDIDPLLWAHFASGNSIGGVRFFEALENANNLQHTSIFYCAAEEPRPAGRREPRPAPMDRWLAP